MMRDRVRQPGPASVRNPFRDPGGTRGRGWPPMSEEQAARTVGDIVTASAAGRTVDVLAALLLALGEGSHQLSIVTERANSTTASAGLSLSAEVAPLCVATAPRSTCACLRC
ncbi:hypothetical protein MBT84_46025 [Streptomyces sp. MBT84]|nr:hypothetical protein [Streptomyces sp. MBT84]